MVRLLVVRLLVARLLVVRLLVARPLVAQLPVAQTLALRALAEGARRVRQDLPKTVAIDAPAQTDSGLVQKLPAPTSAHRAKPKLPMMAATLARA